MFSCKTYVGTLMQCRLCFVCKESYNVRHVVMTTQAISHMTVDFKGYSSDSDIYVYDKECGVIVKY